MTNFLLPLRRKSTYTLWIYVISVFCLNTQILECKSQFIESHELDTLSLYKVTGTKITCTARRFLLSGTGSLQAVKETEVNGKNVILVRGKVDKLGGILGFIISLLKVYKGAETSDSYIDIETHLPVQCIEYKQQKDGTKKITEHIYYDREKQSIKLLVDGKVLKNVPYDIQDLVSVLVDFLYKVNTQKMAVGKILVANMLTADKNAGMKVGEVVVEVTKMEVVEEGVIYTVTSKKLPDVLKYPTILSVRLLDNGKNLIPVSGIGIIKIPVLGKIKIKMALKVTRIKNRES